MARERTFAVAKATIIEPSTRLSVEQCKSLASKYGLILNPQVDLLYVHSCLVTAGINDNDDVFLKDELWNARKTPVLKPSNWQHNDKDILGVIYSVEAKYLDGSSISIDQKDTPTEPFELHTEEVIFKLIHPERAQEIMDRAAKGNLFVSMEAWFDNYDYGLFGTDGTLKKIIARTEQTNFLDNDLKARGGRGQYEDQRLGRVLRSLTFGGQGFVDMPANKRSHIHEVRDLNAPMQPDKENALLDLLDKIVEQIKCTKETNSMTVEKGEMPEQVLASAVETVLDKRDKRAKAEAEQEAAKNKVTTLSEENISLKSEVAKLKVDLTSKDATIKVLADRVNKFNDVIKTLSGATPNTPPEISKIDSANDVKSDSAGDAEFNAQISWINDSVASLSAKAAKAESLEAELHKAAIAYRESEIREVFADTPLNEAEVNAFVETGLGQEDESYQGWLVEKQLIVAAMKDSKKPAKDSVEPDEDDAPQNGKFPFDKKKTKSTQFDELTALLNKRNASRPYDQGQTEDVEPIPGGSEVSSGVNPGSLKNPKWKIAGGADNDPSKVLDNVEPQKGVNLAGASQAANDEKENHFKVLANELYSVDDGSKKTGQKPGFDPVN